MSAQSTIDFAEATLPSDVSREQMPARRRWRTRPRGRVLQVICFDLGIFLLLLLACEIALQLMAPGYGHDYYDLTLTGSHPVTFNSDGFRGPAVPLAKEPGETRILSLGDSTTFGTGASVEDTWPLQLRDLVADEDAHHPVTVMNVALQGTRLADLTYAYEHRWAGYHPDVVTLLVSSNMISFAWIERNQAPQMPPYVVHPNQGGSSPAEQVGRALGRLCLPHFLSLNTQRALYWLGVTDHRIANPAAPFGALLAHGWRQGDLPAGEADQAWSCFAGELAELQKTTARHGTRLIVGFSPCRFDVSGGVYDNEKNVPRDRMTIDPSLRLSQLCAAQNITCIDTLGALRSARHELSAQRGRTEPLYIMFDYNHLNADGHGAVARALLPEVRNAVLLQTAATGR